MGGPGIRTPPLFYIHLPRRKDRWEELRRLISPGILAHLQVHEAVDGELAAKTAQVAPNGVLDEDDETLNLLPGTMQRTKSPSSYALKAWRREVLPGEIGCALSHHSLWERVA